MKRTFDWRDVSLVRTLGTQGLFLDTATGLTRSHSPLSAALLEMWFPGQGTSTVVWKPDAPSPVAAFGQLTHRSGSKLARVLYVAPQWSEAQEGWLNILEQLSVEAGKRGAHNLIGEVDENSGEFESLRGGGFAVYARQSIWKHAGTPNPVSESMLATLRPMTSQDLIGIGTLYSNVVPRLVQQVEPPPRRARGYVLEKKNEIIAYLDVRRGPRGWWVDPYLHPEADDVAEDVIGSGLRLIAEANKTNRPVYVCVRRYQDWLQSILERARCQIVGTQAVMVKRLAVRLSEPVIKSLPVIDAKVVPPIVRYTKRTPPSSHSLN